MICTFDHTEDFMHLFIEAQELRLGSRMAWYATNRVQNQNYNHLMKKC